MRLSECGLKNRIMGSSNSFTVTMVICLFCLT
ncbi:hypothetical protein Golob_025012 [Gossypium lobatum]|uniref:Uncharacterized protein n=1 Tax=Gossypium lobatum TaxID=34289 RepID=A0A7J8NFM9_9ROSI|nr:hypothetical protein [Gossypium lobatum]